VRVLLDTDTVSAALRQQLDVHIRGARVHLSAVTVGELYYGFEKSGRHQHLRRRFESVVLPWAAVIPFGLPSALVYAHLRAELERGGHPLADADLRIASTALAHDLTLITGNEKHFARIPGLRVENWLR